MMYKKMNLNDKKELVLTAKALASETRIDILRLLCEEQLNINEISERLKIPASSAAVNIKVLEEGGLIRTELQPGIRGSMKVCYKNLDEFNVDISVPDQDAGKFETISMPIGNYVDYMVTPTCGMVSENGRIDEEDQPRCFYNPDRIKAKLIWFRTGYLEYRFPNAGMQGKTVRSVEISAELCSEAADYDLNCKSDITMWINGEDAGTWTSPSDFGGRRGKLNPDWWPDKNSQYGLLKTWRLDGKGTYIDGEPVSSRNIDEFQLAKHPFISVRIGIKENADYRGGINIFGRNFGDFPQDILLKIEY